MPTLSPRPLFGLSKTPTPTEVARTKARTGRTFQAENVGVKATRYFREQVLRKRPYIDPAWCIQIVSEPLHREVQPDGRVRMWGEVLRPGETAPRFLRVVTLEDGETIHNAFFDRRFRKDDP